jgi:hypothetical protein
MLVIPPTDDTLANAIGRSGLRVLSSVYIGNQAYKTITLTIECYATNLDMWTHVSVCMRPRLQVVSSCPHEKCCDNDTGHTRSVSLSESFTLHGIIVNTACIIDQEGMICNPILFDYKLVLTIYIE